MRPGLGLTAGVAMTALAGCAAEVGQGQSVYEERCAACHGATGLGDGPFARQLYKAPSDLTTLAERNDGTFPRLYVTDVIDGYARGSHFSGAMPEFGPLLAEDARLESGDGVVTPVPELLVAVVDYLESLQK